MRHQNVSKNLSKLSCVEMYIHITQVKSSKSVKDSSMCFPSASGSYKCSYTALNRWTPKQKLNSIKNIPKCYQKYIWTKLFSYKLYLSNIMLTQMMRPKITSSRTLYEQQSLHDCQKYNKNNSWPAGITNLNCIFFTGTRFLATLLKTLQRLCHIIYTTVNILFSCQGVDGGW